MLLQESPASAFKSAVSRLTYRSWAVFNLPQLDVGDRNKPWTYNCTLCISLKMKNPAQIGPGETEANIVVAVLGMVVVTIISLQVVSIVVVPRTTAKNFYGLIPSRLNSDNILLLMPYESA